MKINTKKAITVYFLIALLGALASMAGDARQAEDPGVLLRAAIEKEEVDGDLQAAIDQYKGIVAKYADNRAVAAKALLRLGGCYEKLGLREATSAYRRVIQDYPDRIEEVGVAREKLSLLAGSRALAKTGAAEFSLRQVWSGADVDIEGSVSPDGRYLSFVDWSTGDLAIRDLATGTNRRLTDKGSWAKSQEFALFSTWSPDSRKIVYQWYAKDEIFELRIIDIKEAAPRVLYRVLKKMEYVQAFDWSPDGKYVLAGFFRTSAPKPPLSVEQVTQLGLISVADGSVKALKTFAGQHPIIHKAWGFVFSPNGRYIAYDAWLGDELDQKRDIFLLSADGATETPLIDHPAVDTVIDWTPGGEGLLFLSNRTGTQDVWFTRISEGHPLGSPLLVKSGTGSIWPMGITSTGAFYYGLQRGGTDVYEVGIEPQTGKISSPVKKAVRMFEGHNAYPAYSPDGNSLAYVYASNMPIIGSQQLLRILSPETGQVRELKLDLDKFGYPQWQPDGRAVSIEGTGKDGRKGIYKVDVQKGDVAPIVLIEQETEIYSHRWSPNGRVLFYSTGDRAGKTGSMFVHDLETGQDEKIPGSPSDAQFFDISPDGKRLTLANRGKKIAIRTMPASGGDLREIYSFEQEGSPPNSPAWSADGRYIYFCKPQAQFSEALWDLYRVPADGGEAQKLDLTMASFRNFSFHPDGQRVAFSSWGENIAQAQVWVMENFLPVAKEKK